MPNYAQVDQRVYYAVVGQAPLGYCRRDLSETSTFLEEVNLNENIHGEGHCLEGGPSHCPIVFGLCHLRTNKK